MKSESSPTGGKTNVLSKLLCGVTENPSGDSVGSVPNGEGTIYIKADRETLPLRMTCHMRPVARHVSKVPWLSTSGEENSHEELARMERQETTSIWEIR